MSEILKFISDLIEVKQEDLNDNYKLSESDFWDSLTKISLIGMIKTDYNKNLTLDDLDNIHTISDLKSFIKDSN
jgi:acyl carrier protein